MPELATLAAFLFLAALLVYVILQVPLAVDAGREIVDLREAEPDVAIDDQPAVTTGAFSARLVLVRPGLRTVTIDGMTSDRGELFAIEVGRPEGWARQDADAQLKRWAETDTVIEVRIREEAGPRQRAWLSSGETAMDLPVAGLLGVQS